MDDYRWVNPHQPQILSTGVILCYIQGVFAILNYPLLGPWAFLILAGLVGGGFGVANEKKWGYVVAVAAAVVQVVVILTGGNNLGDVGVIIELAFAVLLVVLLMHPTSRSYQRIWFK